MYNSKYLKYANNQAINNNIIMAILYLIAYPTIKIFVFFSIKPNFITSLSLLFSFIAIFTLLNHQIFYFVIFYFISVHLDFCDGPVARITSRVSRSAFNYDHLSDLLKFAITIISIAFFYNKLIYWFVSSLAITTFLFFVITNHELSYFSKKVKSEIYDKSFQNKQRLKIIITHLRIIITTISGHTVLGLIILPLNYNIAINYLVYICTITFARSCVNIIKLSKM